MTDANGHDQTRFVRSPASAPPGPDAEADGIMAGPFEQTYVAKAPPAGMTLDEVDFDVTSGFEENSGDDAADIFDITKGADDDEPFDVAPDIEVAEVAPVAPATPTQAPMLAPAAAPEPMPAQGSSGMLFVIIAIVAIAAGVAAWLVLF